MRAAKEISVADQDRSSEADERSGWTAEALLDDVSEGFVAYDTAWRLRYINRTAEAYLQALTQSAPRQILGKSVWEVFPSLVGSEMERCYRLAAANEGPLSFEICSPVTRRWFMFRASPSARGLSVFFRDITEHKSANEALRRSEARLRSVYDNSLEGILITSPDGDTYEANPAACRMFGRTAEEIVGMHRERFVDADDPRLGRMLAERDRAGRVVCELSMIRKDGARFPVRISSAIFVDADGRRRAITTFHDLSETKRLEVEQAKTVADLQDAEEQLRLTIDNAPIGMALIGLQGQWLRVNQRVTEIVGYSAEELRHLTFQDVTHPDDLAKDLVLFEAMLRGEISRYELPKRYVHKDGAIVDILLSASILRDDHGAPRLFIVQIQDLREKKRLEAQLTLSDRMASIGTLASGIAHEINNPLAYVMLNLAALAEELRPLVEAAAPRRARALLDLVDDARTGAERVRKIVRGLKTFARAGEDHRVPMTVESAIEVAVNMTAGELRHRARLVKSYGLTPRVVADEARLGQVFINLLVNAAHAIPEGNAGDNEIGITTSTDAEGRAVIEISDTGCGIPSHLRARIFDPFFTTKEIGVGTGLGLSISHEIVAALGGLIEVSSELGKGTTFRVMLPGCDPS
ncbi:MAG: PAS domain S-box protein [Byssovorax sp.]